MNRPSRLSTSLWRRSFFTQARRVVYMRCERGGLLITASGKHYIEYPSYSPPAIHHFHSAPFSPCSLSLPALRASPPPYPPRPDTPPLPLTPQPSMEPISRYHQHSPPSPSLSQSFIHAAGPSFTSPPNALFHLHEPRRSLHAYITNHIQPHSHTCPTNASQWLYTPSTPHQRRPGLEHLLFLFATTPSAQRLPHKHARALCIPARYSLPPTRPARKLYHLNTRLCHTLQATPPSPCFPLPF